MHGKQGAINYKYDKSAVPSILPLVRVHITDEFH
jgi:hypothetical protein